MPTLLVSFHGGDQSGSINDVVAFPEREAPYDLLLAATPHAVVHPLKELRKFLFDSAGSYLYLANGYKQLSQVLRFTPLPEPDDRWIYERIYASRMIDHPFDLIFAFDGALFVSSQDKHWVTRHDPNGTATVFVEGFNAVRGLAYDGTYLYVADAGANCVVVVDARGKEGRRLSVPQPVHLLYEPTRKWLFMGSEVDNSVFVWSPANPTAQPVRIVANTNPRINHTAGMALQPGSKESATLYVASRKAFQVLAFPLDFSSGRPTWSPATTSVILDKLDDEPEFVGIQGGIYG